MSDWQPIDTAPKDGSLFLVCNAGGMYRFMRWSKKIKTKTKFGFTFDRQREAKIIYPAYELEDYFWQPLPKAPDGL